MATRPQTIGYALLDSPSALAAWMIDHDTDAYYKIARAFVDGQPSGNLTRDHILDNVTAYWLTGTGASAARSYWEAYGPDAPAAGSQPLPPPRIPVGFSTFPGEIWRTPRSWAEKSYPTLSYFGEAERGGHFAAWEEPELFAAELRAAFHPIARTAGPRAQSLTYPHGRVLAGPRPSVCHTRSERGARPLTCDEPARQFGARRWSDSTNLVPSRVSRGDRYELGGIVDQPCVGWPDRTTGRATPRSETRRGCITETGDGPLVVLLHGFPEFWYGWRLQIAPLAAAGFRVVAPDLRGYNLSSKPRRRGLLPPASWPPTCGLIRERGAESALLVGHDWGGTVAWTAAMNHPRSWTVWRSSTRHPRKLNERLRHPDQLARSWYFFYFALPDLPEHHVRANDWEFFQHFLRDAQPPYTKQEIDHYIEAWSQPGASAAMIASTPSKELACQSDPPTPCSLSFWSTAPSPTRRAGTGHRAPPGGRYPGDRGAEPWASWTVGVQSTERPVRCACARASKETR
jgi:pimeloyl-ACP methyl ester carboxylesterase